MSQQQTTPTENPPTIVVVGTRTDAATVAALAARFVAQGWSPAQAAHDAASALLGRRAAA